MTTKTKESAMDTREFLIRKISEKTPMKFEVGIVPFGFWNIKKKQYESGEAEARYITSENLEKRAEAIDKKVNKLMEGVPVKMSIICCSCKSLVGCKDSTARTLCEDCQDWNTTCFLDFMDYKDVKETHSYCPTCMVVILNNIEQRKLHKKVRTERRKS